MNIPLHFFISAAKFSDESRTLFLASVAPHTEQFSQGAPSPSLGTDSDICWRKVANGAFASLNKGTGARVWWKVICKNFQIFATHTLIVSSARLWTHPLFGIVSIVHFYLVYSVHPHHLSRSKINSFRPVARFTSGRWWTWRWDRECSGGWGGFLLFPLSNLIGKGCFQIISVPARPESSLQVQEYF